MYTNETARWTDAGPSFGEGFPRRNCRGRLCRRQTERWLAKSRFGRRRGRKVHGFRNSLLALERGGWPRRYDTEFGSYQDNGKNLMKTTNPRGKSKYQVKISSQNIKSKYQVKISSQNMLEFAARLSVSWTRGPALVRPGRGLANPHLCIFTAAASSWQTRPRRARASDRSRPKTAACCARS
jgi:hypothetical protein